METTAQAAMIAMSPPSMTDRSRRTAPDLGPAYGLADAAAKPDAMIRPTGVAIANPTFG